MKEPELPAEPTIAMTLASAVAGTRIPMHPVDSRVCVTTIVRLDSLTLRT
jgi:hypothetical protein